ncbi:MAG: energy transducer TonB [Flavobacteriaceae bacterium]|nr:energy transducer TonB [Flavobacteriaceae bacterium]
MEPKKNPKADIRRNSPTYLQIGLIAMLLVTYLVINWKQYEKVDTDVQALNILDDLDEEVPMLDDIKPPPPPPPPPAAPEVIEVVDDEEEVPETIIQDAEVDQEAEIVIPEDVEVEEEEVDVEVPFAVLQDKPIFPGCESAPNKEKCMQEKIDKIINRKFDTEIATDYDLEGKQTIYVAFKIGKDGKVSNIRPAVRGKSAKTMSPKAKKALENEAKRVIGLLPKFKPGKQRGKAVIVPYMVPIKFVVTD